MTFCESCAPWVRYYEEATTLQEATLETVSSLTHRNLAGVRQSFEFLVALGESLALQPQVSHIPF